MKCGWIDATVKYQPGRGPVYLPCNSDHLVAEARQERLTRRCISCGYAWDEAPLPAAASAVATAGAVPAVVAADDRAKSPYWAYLDSLDGAESRRTMKGCLYRLARLMAGKDPAGTDPDTGRRDAAVLAITGDSVHWHLLRAEHTQNIRAMISDATSRKKDGIRKPWSTAYRNKHIVALRQVLDQAWLLGLMDVGDRARAQRLKPFIGSTLPAGQHLPVERVGALFAACDADLNPDVEDEQRREQLRRVALRDAALLAALHSTGARRFELAAVSLADYDPVARSLRIRGKRNKERLVYLTSSAVARVEAWLTVRGRDAGGLFAPFTPSGGHIRRTKTGTVAHMSGQTVWGVITNRAEQAGLDQIPGAHDFRRTFTGELLDAGVVLATAQALAGHASPATTARYDRRPERTRRPAVDNLPTPESVRYLEPPEKKQAEASLRRNCAARSTCGFGRSVRHSTLLLALLHGLQFRANDWADSDLAALLVEDLPAPQGVVERDGHGNDASSTGAGMRPQLIPPLLQQGAFRSRADVAKHHMDSDARRGLGCFGTIGREALRGRPANRIQDEDPSLNLDHVDPPREGRFRRPRLSDRGRHGYRDGQHQEEVHAPQEGRAKGIHFL